MKQRQDVDLPPHEWRSERKKRREPILGSGALPFLGELIVIAATFGLLIAVGATGIQLKGTVHSLLYGEPVARSEPLPPGNYKWSPENGIERIN